MSGSRLKIDIKKSWQDFELDCALDIEVGQPLALFGASGSGKTSLLRCLAGLERADSGHILYEHLGAKQAWFNSTDKVHLPSFRRKVGYMFQEGRLFPHLNVKGNLEYADKRNRDFESALDFGTVSDLLEIGPLLERSVHQLSGGEKQRVALARTLLSRPNLLMLDEPFSGVDINRKSEVLPFLLRLTSSGLVPIIYVSHDVEEVLNLTENTALISNGTVSSVGKTTDVLNKFLSKFSSDSELEPKSILLGKVTAYDPQFMLADISLGDNTISLPANEMVKIQSKAAVSFNASDIAIATSQPMDISTRNIMRGKIISIENDEKSPFSYVKIDVSCGHIIAQITRASLFDLQLQVDRVVYAIVKSASFQTGLY